MVSFFFYFQGEDFQLNLPLHAGLANFTSAIVLCQESLMLRASLALGFSSLCNLYIICHERGDTALRE